MHRLWVACLCLLLSCDALKNVDPSKITIPQLPPLDLSGLKLPKTADGNYLVMQLSNAQLEIDPTIRDPLTALGDCSDQVTYCFSPSEKRSLDDCVRSVRTCTTDKPWLEPLSCCPKTCQADYAAARAAGKAPETALDQVFYAEHTCFPGLAAALEGK